MLISLHSEHLEICLAVTSGSVHIERVPLRVSLRVTWRLNGYNAFLWSYSHCTAENIKGG